jgi:hypothetical protein
MKLSGPLLSLALLVCAGPAYAQQAEAPNAPQTESGGPLSRSRSPAHFVLDLAGDKTGVLNNIDDGDTDERRSIRSSTGAPTPAPSSAAEATRPALGAVVRPSPRNQPDKPD